MTCFSFSDAGWLPVEEPHAFFTQIDLIDGQLSLGPHVSARARSLPMYENVRLLCLTSGEWEEGLRICYLIHEGKLFRLNGTSPPIHEVNAEAPIRITEENALFYLSFFCLFVHGEGGPFYVVCDLDDELLPDGFADARPVGKPEALTPRQLFRRPRLFGRDDKGAWRASALVHYANAVFLADFLVQPGGMIEMSNDEPLLADLPCRVTLLLASGAGPA